MALKLRCSKNMNLNSQHSVQQYKKTWIASWRNFLQCSLLMEVQFTCTAWVESLNLRDDGRGKTYRSRQKHGSLSLHDLLSTGHYLLDVSFITSLKVKFMHCFNHTEHYRKQTVLPHTRKTRLHFSPCIFNWNTSVTGHKEGAVGFPQGKQLPRSTANSPVSISIMAYLVHSSKRTVLLSAMTHMKIQENKDQHTQTSLSQCLFIIIILCGTVVDFNCFTYLWSI
jgi:hypothetical protein